MHEWGRLKVASIGGVVFFGFLFFINLINPRWLAFGDVRLSFVVGFGLAWVSFECLIECLFFANLLAVVVGLGLIAAHKAERRSAVPYRPLLGHRHCAGTRHLELTSEASSDRRCGSVSARLEVALDLVGVAAPERVGVVPDPVVHRDPARGGAVGVRHPIGHGPKLVAREQDVPKQESQH